MQGEVLLSLKQDARSAGSTKTPSASTGIDHPAYAETDYPHRAFGWSALYSLRVGKYLYIEAPERELYDQAADPHAFHNLATSAKAVADTLASQLEEFRLRTSTMRPAEQNINSEQAEQLQALGYVTSASGKSSANAQNERGPDPKEKIKVANLLHEALLAMEDDRYRDAIPELEQVLAQEPTMPLANLELGRAWNGLERYDKALPWLRKAVDLTPESGRAHFELGTALAETGDWTGSALQLEAAVARAPDSDELHVDLATAYEHLGRISEATQAFQDTLRLNPDHYRANLMFGRLLGMHGNPRAAVPYLLTAAKLQPRLPDAHKFLANVYTELGEEENARRERAEAERRKPFAKPQ